MNKNLCEDSSSGPLTQGLFVRGGQYAFDTRLRPRIETYSKSKTKFDCTDQSLLQILSLLNLYKGLPKSSRSGLVLGTPGVPGRDGDRDGEGLRRFPAARRRYDRPYLGPWHDGPCAPRSRVGREYRLVRKGGTCTSVQSLSSHAAGLQRVTHLSGAVSGPVQTGS